MGVIKTAIGGSATVAFDTDHIVITGADDMSDVVLAGSVLAKIGLSAGTKAATNTFDGQNLTIAKLEGGQALDITFGVGNGKINTLDALNVELAKNFMQASIDKAGKLTFTTVNDHASQSIGAFGGSATTASTGMYAGITADARSC